MVSAQTMAEVKKKALAGIPLVKPTAATSALYNQFKPTAPVVAKPTTPAGNAGLIARPVTTQPVMSPMNTAPNNSQSGLNAVGLGGQQSQMSATKNMATPMNGMVGPTNNGNPNHNSNQSIPDYGGMTPGMIEQILSGYKSNANSYYSPESDPVYNSMMQLANKQADKAGLATMESMNDRGILNSTVTSDRVGQIKQGASDAVIGSIPGLAANYSNQQANNQAGLQTLLNSVLGAGQFQQTFGEDNRRFDTNFTEDSRRFDKNFTLDEAKVSGRYIPQEAQSAIDIILRGKEASAQGGISAAQRAENSKQASEARRLLATLGVDISGLDTNVGYNDALKNSYYLGRDSLPQQEMDLAKTEVMGRDTSTTAQGYINQILSSKQASVKGGISKDQRASNAKTAETARNKLSALGFDVSGLAGNIGYDQALKNSKSLGQPTLQAVNSAAANALGRDTLAMQKDQFGQELKYKENTFDREMNYKEQTTLIEQDLAARGLDLESVKLQIESFSASSDAEYKQYQQELGISDANAAKNTSKAISEISKSGSVAEALATLSEAGSAWADQGVDNREVLKAIYQMFPQSKEAIEEGTSDHFGPKP